MGKNLNRRPFKVMLDDLSARELGKIAALLANLSENLALLARINPAEGNKVIASLFRLVAVDYGTRETVARYTWENV